MTAQDARHYAVPDPTTGDMTYWRRDARRRLKAWPTKPQAHHGPQLWHKLTREPGPHDHIVPAGLGPREQEVWVPDWYLTVRHPWLRAIEAVIEADPEAAMARFSVWCMRCACCGRVLRDADSKALGVGPECRPGFPDEILRAIARQVSTLHVTAASRETGEKPLAA